MDKFVHFKFQLKARSCRKKSFLLVDRPLEREGTFFDARKKCGHQALGGRERGKALIAGPLKKNAASLIFFRR